MKDSEVKTGKYQQVVIRVKDFLELHRGEGFTLNDLTREIGAETVEARKYAATVLSKMVAQNDGLCKIVSGSRTFYRTVDNSVEHIQWVNASEANVLDIKWPYGIDDGSQFGFDGRAVISPGDIIVIAGGSNFGKGHPHGTHVLTETGYKVIEDLRCGDKIFGQDGYLHNVTGIFHRGIQPCYRFMFSDRTSVEVDSDHLWKVRRTHKSNKHKRIWLVRSTKQIIEQYGMLGRDANRTLAIPNCKPLQFERKPVPLNPYLVGLLLGDGGLHGSSITFTTADDSLLNAFRQNGFDIGHKSDKYTYGILEIKPILEKLGMLELSYNKFIPDVYKYNAFDVRLAVLRGLMDTDGWIQRNGDVCEFCSTSKQLADDIRFLVESLGGSPTIYFKPKYYQYKDERREGRQAYYVSFRSPFNPFTLSRKTDRWHEPINTLDRKIVQIEPTGNKETICISTDAPDGLYLTEDCIVTHNTAFCLNLLWNNMDRYPCTLMGNEYTPIRFKRRVAPMIWANPLKADGTPKFELIERYENWQDIIRPDNINIIDWINLGDNFYEVGKIIEGIKSKLHAGIAVIALQKGEGKSLGAGGQFGEHLSSVYLVMDHNRMTIRKVKEWKDWNPNGSVYTFEIKDGGAKFHNIRQVKKCPHCWGSGQSKGGQCMDCAGTGWVEVD